MPDVRRTTTHEFARGNINWIEIELAQIESCEKRTGWLNETAIKRREFLHIQLRRWTRVKKRAEFDPEVQKAAS